MKKLIIRIVVVLYAFSFKIVEAQNVYDNFYKALHEKDSATVEQILSEIRYSNDQSAERYIAEYNYWVNKAHVSEGPILSTELPEGVDVSGVFTLTDSMGNIAGYMYGVEYYDSLLTDSALLIISEGIQRHPNRLDMRFGKIYLLGQSGRWQSYTDEILSTLEHSEKNNNAWKYPNVTESMDTILIYSILDYEKALYSALSKSDTLTVQDTMKIHYMRSIAQRMLRLYPHDVFSLNIMAVTYHVMGQEDSALVWLLRAEKVNPRDALVLLNIADTYNRLGDRKKEKIYLKKATKYGDKYIRDEIRNR
ncbi:MAG: hypothetical protein J6Y47_02920 [Bacteroidales bacterium]|nr:hypothetical protein [Bacteroidales bacterium]